MNNIKLFAKNDKELETQIQKIKIYSQHTEMKFGIEKRAKLIMKRGKREITEEIELPNQERIQMLGEKENYKYFGILWVQSQVAAYQRLWKWYLIPPLSNIRYVSREKWSNQGKEVAPSPTPRGSRYWKWSLLVALNYGRQLYFLLYLAASQVGSPRRDRYEPTQAGPGSGLWTF